MRHAIIVWVLQEYLLRLQQKLPVGEDLEQVPKIIHPSERRPSKLRGVGRQRHRGDAFLLESDGGDALNAGQVEVGALRPEDVYRLASVAMHADVEVNKILRSGGFHDAAREVAVAEKGQEAALLLADCDPQRRGTTSLQ